MNNTGKVLESCRHREQQVLNIEDGEARVFAGQWADHLVELYGHRPSKSPFWNEAENLREQLPTVSLLELQNLPSLAYHIQFGAYFISLLKCKMHTKTLRSALRLWALVVFKNQRIISWEWELHELFAPGKWHTEVTWQMSLTQNSCLLLPIC